MIRYDTIWYDIYDMICLCKHIFPDPRTSSFTISSEAMTMSAAQVIQGEGIVDATLGRDTEFLFDYGSAGIGLDLESPNGNKYTEGSTECHVDSTVLTVRCLFSGSSEVRAFLIIKLT